MEETNKQNNNKGHLDSEMSVFERFEHEFKETIFGVLFVILDSEDTSVFWAVVLGFIEFC